MHNHLHRTAQYLSYLLYATNHYSLHSPFLFDLYHSVIANGTQLPSMKRVEPLRKQLAGNDRTIQMNDFGAGAGKYTTRTQKISTIARNSLSSAKTSALLHRLANYFQCQHIVELGTSLGINTAYLAAEAQNREVVTFEGCPNIAHLAGQNFQQLGIDHIKQYVGPIDEQLPAYLQHNPQVDLAFLDANHRYEPTMRYFNWLLDVAHPQTLFVFDDIHWSVEMTRAWQAIIRHPGVTLTLDLYQVGLVFVNPELPRQHHILSF